MRITKRFTLIGLSVEEHLKTKLSWLKERLDMDNKSLSKLVQRQPSVLCFSIEENLELKLAWLPERL